MEKYGIIQGISMTTFTMKNDPSIKVDVHKSPYSEEDELVRVVRQFRYQLIEGPGVIYVRHAVNKTPFTSGPAQLNWEDHTIPLNWSFA